MTRSKKYLPLIPRFHRVEQKIWEAILPGNKCTSWDDINIKSSDNRGLQMLHKQKKNFHERKYDIKLTFNLSAIINSRSICSLVIIFPISTQFVAMQKPDFGHIFWKAYIFIKSNLLFYQN